MESSPIKILVIEDDPDDVHLIRAALRESSLKPYDLHHADRLATGWTRLDEGDFQLVLLDLWLPDCGGLDTVARTHARAPGVPIIVLTGLDDEMLAVKLLEAGAQDYLLKGDLEGRTLGRVIRYAIERKRAELHLRELAAIVEQSKDAIFRMNLESVIQTWNHAAEELYGYRPEEIIGQPAAILMPSEHEHEMAQIMDKIRSGEKVEHFATERLRKDGERLTMSVTVAPILNEHGKVVAASTIARDITEHRRAEETVKRMQNRFQALTENAPDGVVLINTAGSIEFASPSARKMFGYAPDENPAIKPAEHTHPDDLHRVISALTEVMETPTRHPTLQYRFRHKDGSWLWIESTFTNLLDVDSVEAIVINFRNVTERKSAEAELQLTGAALAAAANAIVITNRQSIITWINPAFTQLTGYTADEAVGQSTRLLQSGFHDEAFYQQMCQTVLSGRVWRGELVNRRKDGSLYYEEQTITPVLDENGTALHFIAIKQNITRRKQAEEQTQAQLGRLAALRKIDLAIASGLDRNLVLNIFLEEVLAQLQADAVAILSYNATTLLLEQPIRRGFRTETHQPTRLRIGQGLAGQVALERRPASISNLAEVPDLLSHSPLLAAEGFVSYHGAPLIAKGQIKGVLEVFHRLPFHPSEDWLDFLAVLAGQAAVAMDNVDLFATLQRSNEDLTLAYEATIEGWSRAMDLRDKETEGHTQRVTQMAMQLAQTLGLPEADLVHLRRGALLHDIGKMGVPDAILLKPEPLTDDEWAIMRQHPAYAYEMLAPISYLRPALDIPYCHHERWDGTGYPRGLRGEAIPFAARIFAVVDVWDALRSDRPYRAAWPEGKVRSHIEALSGTHFDPKVVEAFLRLEPFEDEKRSP